MRVVLLKNWRDNATWRSSTYFTLLIMLTFGTPSALDVAIVAGNDDLCSLASQKDRGSYACFHDGDDPYRGQPQPGEGGTLSGVIRPGTLRFLVGYDRLLSQDEPALVDVVTQPR